MPQSLTSSFRKSFLSTVTPHNPVSSSSIARWLKDTLKEAGFGEEYGTHSARGAAATTASMSGISTQEIMVGPGRIPSANFIIDRHRQSQLLT